MKYEKIFLRRLPLSRFLIKTLRVIKIAMQSFSKICRSDSSLNCRSRHSRIKLKHTKVKWPGKQGRDPDGRVILANYYVCVYFRKHLKSVKRKADVSSVI